jgi:hypothetical protein
VGYSVGGWHTRRVFSAHHHTAYQLNTVAVIMSSVGAAAGASARREERWRQTWVLLCVVTSVPCVEGMSSDDAKVEVVVTLSITFLVSPPHTCTHCHSHSFACSAHATAAPMASSLHTRHALLLPWPVCCTHAMHCCSRGQFVAHTPCTAALMASSTHGAFPPLHQRRELRGRRHAHSHIAVHTMH